MTNYKSLAITSLMLLAGASNAKLLFDRGLPTTNINNAAGSDRSNVAWAYKSASNATYLVGDDFTLEASTKYCVDTIRVWVVGSESLLKSQSLSLWGGTTGAGLNLKSLDYTLTKVVYSSGATYQGSSGSMIDMWQVDFKTNWIVDGAIKQSFYVGGPVYDTGSGYAPVYSSGMTFPMVHASNSALSGSLQQGADNLFRWGYGYVGYTGAWEGGYTNTQGKGWDKSSDINIQVMGHAVPGPVAVLPFAFGLLAAAKRRRK